MELIFNELSLFPPSFDDNAGVRIFRGLLLTFRKSKERYDFNHIRFPEDYSNLNVTETKTFQEWIYSITDFTLRTAILSIAKRPFVENLADEELEKYFSNNFVIESDDVPTRTSPLGLPVAYIKSVPLISLDSHLFWGRRKIKISGEKNVEDRQLYVYNLCHLNDVDSAEIDEWGKNHLSVNLGDKQTLVKFLNFKKFEIRFEGIFFNKLLEWKGEDTDTFKRLLDLMKDVEEHPFTGGIGKTESLKYTDRASKRITHEDRLVYSLHSNVVTFIDCKTHYDNR